MKRKSPALSSGAKNVLAGFVVAGALVVALAMVLAPLRAWTAYLTAAFYFLTIALGGLVVTALLYVAKAGWGVVVKRVAEGVAGYLPWGAASMLVVLLGAHTLYPWTGPEAHEDPILLAKASYLNLPAFAARMVIVLGLWLLFARLLRKGSVAQDTDKAVRHTTRAVALSAGFLLVFALSFSVASFDWLMSLSPHWQSTIFAWYNMAGVVVAGLAVTIALAIRLRRSGALAEVNPSHLHDLGKLLFAMSTFWAYLWVSQYLLVWYANMPEETVYYVNRTQGGYRFLFWANLVINWLVPFVALLPRAAKRSEAHLLRVCVVVLLGRWLDVYLQVAPRCCPITPGSASSSSGRSWPSARRSSSSWSARCSVPRSSRRAILTWWRASTTRSSPPARSRPLETGLHVGRELREASSVGLALMASSCVLETDSGTPAAFAGNMAAGADS